MALTKIDDRGLKTPIELQNDEQIRLGNAGSSLKIYHENSTNHSFIEQASSVNALFLEANYPRFRSRLNHEMMILANLNGPVELYYDNSKKFETTSSGIEVFGNIQLDDGYELRFGNSTDFLIKHDSANTYLSNQTGELVLNGDTIRLRKGDGLEDHLKCFANNKVELYYDNSKKLETTSYGVGLTGRVEIDRGGAVDTGLQIDTTSTTGASRIMFRENNADKGQVAYSHDNDQIELVASALNGAALIVNGNQTALLINSDGYVTKPKNPVFHAFGGPSNVAINTDIVFGQQRFAVGGGYNTSNGVYTVPITGYYHFYGQVYRQNSENDSWWGFYINGSQKSESRLQNNHGGDAGRGYATLQCSLYWYCSAGDTVKMRVGTSGAIHCNNTLSYFCGNLVG